jgi:predicted RNA-binding Zn ribbon-like protein
MSETDQADRPRHDDGEAWELLGGSLCLDFLNTVDWRASDTPTELLVSEAALLDWARESGALSAAEADRALPSDALARVLAFRERLAPLFRAVVEGRPLGVGALDPLNLVIGSPIARRRLVASPAGIAWEEDTVAASPDRHLIARVADDAAALLTGDRLRRVRICHGPRCGWFFLDASRAGNRRWCSMTSCGNRAKVRAHYEQGRAARD